MSGGSAKKGKPASASRVTLAQLMHPEHANLMGNVHGGWIMKLVDEAGALACMRHSQQRVTLVSEVSYVGRTSMEVEVSVTAENPLTMETTHTNTAYLVYVALDEHGKPAPVPPLILDTERQKQRWEQAKARQDYRLSHARQVEEAMEEPEAV
jgi:acyl-CoA hydrolase